jgi:3-hydroxyisobutyrate dehydrogenase
MSAQQRIGFVGIGNMGWPMAANVARAGFPLTVFDADRARAPRFASELGAKAAPSLAELGRAADIVVTMLPTGADVRAALVEHENGALAASLAKGAAAQDRAVVIDMSSSEPVGTQQLGDALAKRGIVLIDAPVSGGVPRAEAGTLTLMIGGEDEAAIGKALPAAAAFIASTEALRVGRRFGLAPEAMMDVMNASTGRNFNSEMTIKQHVISGKYATGFQLGLMAKDVKIAADLAETIAIDAPLARLVRAMWSEAREGIGARADFTAAIKHWQRRDTH